MRSSKCQYLFKSLFKKFRNNDVLTGSHQMGISLLLKSTKGKGTLGVLRGCSLDGEPPVSPSVEEVPPFFCLRCGEVEVEGMKRGRRRNKTCLVYICRMHLDISITIFEVYNLSMSSLH